MKIKQVLDIDYGHRLIDSPDLLTKKCLNCHGHTAKITVQFEQDNTRSGMVLDFSATKEIVKRYDHVTILRFDDPLYDFLYKEKPDQVIKILGNPTIENLARLIHGDILAKYPDLKKLRVDAVEGYKGPDSPIVSYYKYDE